LVLDHPGQPNIRENNLVPCPQCVQTEVIAPKLYSFHCVFLVPEPPAGMTKEEMKARSMVEKKTVINLLEAFAVSVKHYLRGEDSIYYKYAPAFGLSWGRCLTHVQRFVLPSQVSASLCTSGWYTDGGRSQTAKGGG